MCKKTHPQTSNEKVKNKYAYVRHMVIKCVCIGINYQFYVQTYISAECTPTPNQLIMITNRTSQSHKLSHSCLLCQSYQENLKIRQQQCCSISKTVNILDELSRSFFVQEILYNLQLKPLLTLRREQDGEHRPGSESTHRLSQEKAGTSF